MLSDDVSLIISDEAGYGVARETENIMKETKKKDEDGNPELKVAGWEGKLIPKELIISELLPEEKKSNGRPCRICRRNRLSPYVFN